MCKLIAWCSTHEHKAHVCTMQPAMLRTRCISMLVTQIAMHQHPVWMQNAPKLKVAIVGSGLAGMSTAVELLDQGYDVDVYEQRPFIGGKVASYRDRDGNHVEMGYVVHIEVHHLSMLCILIITSNSWGDIHTYLGVTRWITPLVGAMQPCCHLQRTAKIRPRTVCVHCVMHSVMHISACSEC